MITPNKLLENSYQYDLFKKELHDLYVEAINKTRGSKYRGFEIDVEDLEEVVAILYLAYMMKENMVKNV